MARVRSEVRYPALWVRLLALRSLILGQSSPWSGSAGGLTNGTYVFVCSAPSCRLGERGVREESTNRSRMCCNVPMHWARYRAPGSAGGTGKLIGSTRLDVYICIECIRPPVVPSDLRPGAAPRHCPKCGKDTLVKFGA
ncbi:hypothetical protein OG317_20525 [Streptomyces sp. NBC_01167]|uniref:hypothetical protein n=1 Tax=Streptomyces sp. NBC_01167 TaxID=2903756 RepID=UPI00386A0421|nr:hypothetical protein OG317_20525 [Streptomyces sp. NBC_01167]